MQVKIKSVKNPTCFYGVKDGSCGSSTFKNLQREIQEYYGNEQLYKSVLSNPSIGMKCVVQMDGKRWYRARVEAVVLTPYGHKIRCFLVDNLDVVLLMSNRVFVSPSWVWNEPSQGIKFSLCGVVPTCLWTDYQKDEVELRSRTSKWEPSAVKYFRELVSSCDNRGKVDVVSVDDNQIHYVYLYLSFDEDLVDLSAADLLINAKFALAQCNACNIEDDPVFKNMEETVDISGQSSLLNGSINGVLKEMSQCCFESEVPKSTEVMLNSSEIQLVAQPCNQLHPFPCLNVSKMSSTVEDESGTWAHQTDKSVNETSHQFSSISLMSKNGTESVNHVLHKGVGRGALGKNRLVDMLANIQRKAVPFDLNNNQNIFQSNSSLKCENSLSKLNQKNTLVESNQLLKKIGEKLSLLSIDNSTDKLTANISVTEQEISLMEKLLGKAKSLLKQPTDFTHSKTSGPNAVVPPNMNMADHCESRVLSSEKNVNTAKSDAHSNLNQKTASGTSTKSPQRKRSEKREVETMYSAKQVTKSERDPKGGTILVKGLNPPSPFSLFCRTPFNPFLRDLLESKFRGPTQVQAYVWSAILSERNVMALSPTGGGKTLAYVIPLAHLLCEEQDLMIDTHKATPLNTGFMDKRGPTVVVLCSSWKNVQSVTACFDAIFKASQQNRHRVLGVSGGPVAEKECAVELVIGCSVLVVSPCSLIRICREKFLSLNRLEYLVVDNVHVLLEEFTDEMREIMRMWMETLNDPDRILTAAKKPKVLCFGIQWTPGVSSFMNKFMTDPLLYINHPLEAAVYGEIDQKVHISRQSFCFDRLLSLIEFEKKKRQGGIAVFVKTPSLMKNLVSSLKTASVYCVGVEPCLMDIEINEIQKQFDDDAATAPILVITDDALDLVDVDNIETAVHFELAKDRHAFGSRLLLMRHYFQSSEGAKPRSHIFITENDIGQVIGLVKFLKRFSNPIPKALQHMAQKAFESKEIMKGQKSLCPNLKAFGSCNSGHACQYRHFINRHLDCPNFDSRYVQVPTEGQVKLLVTCVFHASLFYVRLVKHSSEERLQWHQFDQLTSDLADHFASYEGRKLVAPPNVGDVFAVKSPVGFVRATLGFVPRISIWKSPAGLTKVAVQLVDSGSFLEAPLELLYELPARLASIPFQAFLVHMCCVKPIDKDTHWLEQANEAVHKIAFEKMVEGKIVQAMGNTIWLQPLVIRSKLPKSGVYVTDCDVRSELLKTGLAVKNPDHITSLLSKFGNPISSVDHCQQSTNVVRYVNGNVQESTKPCSEILSQQTQKVQEIQASTQKSLPVNEGVVSHLPSDGDQSDFPKSSESTDSNSSVHESTKGNTSIQAYCGKDFDLALENSEQQVKTEEERMTTYPADDNTLTQLHRAEEVDQLPPLCSTVTLPSFEYQEELKEPPPLVESSCVEETSEDETIPESFNSSLALPYAEQHRQMVTTPYCMASSTPPPSSSESILESENNNTVDSDIDKQVVCRTSSIEQPSFDELSFPDESETLDLANFDVNIDFGDLDGILKSAMENTQGADKAISVITSSEHEGDVESDSKDVDTDAEMAISSNNVAAEQNISPRLSLKGEIIDAEPPVDYKKDTRATAKLSLTKEKEVSWINATEKPSFKLPIRNTKISKATDTLKISKNKTEVVPVNHAQNGAPSQNTAEKARPSLENEAEVFVASNLPPLTLKDKEGLLHPLCVLLSRSSSPQERLGFCQDLYVTCSELPHDVTERDLVSLRNALSVTAPSNETFLILGSLLTLAISNVPVSDYLSLRHLVGFLCSTGASDEVAQVVITLCKTLLRNADADPSDLLDSSKLLLTHTSNEISMNNSSSLMGAHVLQLLDLFTDACPSLIADLKDVDMLQIMNKIKVDGQHERLKRSLFVKMLESFSVHRSSNLESEDDELKEVAPPSVKAPSKVYDALNYDRFNCIDTDTDSACSYRPYTPILARFDTDTDTLDTETEPEKEELLYGI